MKHFDMRLIVGSVIVTGDIFAKVLLRLVNEGEAALSVAGAIIWNFDRLPFNIREQLLLKLADNDKAAPGVALAISYYFKNLPPNVQQLLFKLADKYSMSSSISDIIKFQGYNLPEDKRKELLAKIKKLKKKGRHRRIRFQK
jgi:hypothetical protein